jgi:hypothetical protein
VTVDLIATLAARGPASARLPDTWPAHPDTAPWGVTAALTACVVGGPRRSWLPWGLQIPGAPGGAYYRAEADQPVSEQATKGARLDPGEPPYRLGWVGARPPRERLVARFWLRAARAGNYRHVTSFTSMKAVTVPFAFVVTWKNARNLSSDPSDP